MLLGIEELIVPSRPGYLPAVGKGELSDRFVRGGAGKVVKIPLVDGRYHAVILVIRLAFTREKGNQEKNE